jgi:predicted nucleic acid-binding protein
MLFIDTWGWVALHNRREPRHGEVKAFYREYRLRGKKIYTTDYVLDETLTLLFRRLPLEQAKKSMESIDDAIAQGYLYLEWINYSRFEETKTLRLKFDDKPRISFTDLTSMVVMKELGVKSILTDDDHFVQLGFDFEKRP